MLLQSCDSHLTVSLGTAEVNEFDDPLGGEHDVGSLDVAMHYAIVVQVVEASCHLSCVVGDGPLIQCTKPT